MWPFVLIWVLGQTSPEPTIAALRAKKTSLDARTRWFAAKEPGTRALLLGRYRADQLAVLTQLCLRGVDPMDCLLAMQVRADAEAGAQGPIRTTFSCESQSHEGNEAERCLEAKLGQGLAVVPHLGASRFLLFLPAPPSGVRVVAGTSSASYEKSGSLVNVQVHRDSIHEGPDALEVLERAMSSRLPHLEPQPVGDARIGRGKDGVFESLPATSDNTQGPLADGAVVLCGDEVKPVGPLVAIVEKPDPLAKATYVAYRHRLPCPEGFVLGRDAKVALGKVRRFALLDSPYLDKERTRKFGKARYREVLDPNESVPSVYGKTCFLEVGKTVTEIHSAYGCQLELAADLNADGVADFIVHTGHESCEDDSLYLSSPNGWTVVAFSYGCE